MDYGEDADLPQNEDSLKKLIRLAVEMGKIQIERDELAAKVAELDNQLKTYSEGLIPTLMEELGLPQLKTKSGLIIDVKKDVYASFPKDNEKRQKAFEYLKKSGDDGLILREFTVELRRDSTADAEALMKFVKESGIAERAKSVDSNESINHNTMLAYLRRQVRAIEEARKNGTDVQDFPLDLFGAFQKTTAQLKVKND